MWRGYGLPLAREALRLVAQVLPLQVPQTRKGRRLRTFRDCPECPEMVEIEMDTMWMGSPLSDGLLHPEEGPRRLVSLSRTIAAGRFEVTFDEWDACVNDGGCGGRTPPDEGWGRGRRPVINVSWEDARAYTAWLSEQTGETYRLPTEVEWEYLARAGTTSRYSWGDAVGTGRANCKNCGSLWDDQQTAPVGSFPANVLGLHDMPGNVGEWVQECWMADLMALPVGAPPRQQKEEACAGRTIRGGGWSQSATAIRTASRPRVLVTSSSGVGFRVVREISAP